MADKKKKETEEKLSEEAAQQIGELTQSLQRLQADFENYKKRIEKDQLLSGQRAVAQFIEQLLPIVDAFELAVKNSGDHDQFVKGVDLIFADVVSLLKKRGLTAIDAIDTQLDPTKHEVLLQEERDDCDDGTVIEEMQKGYMLGDNVLRTSKVKIASCKKDAHQTNTSK
jgi:molecular chaperone GrpE